LINKREQQQQQNNKKLNGCGEKKETNNSIPAANQEGRTALDMNS
jgi:hypothetical protein